MTGARSGWTRWIPWILAGLVGLVFGRAIGFDFTSYDDPIYVTSNPHIAHGLTWEAIGWASGSGYAANWHPVTWISHMIDIEIFEFHPWGHHLTSVLLHLISTLLLFRILDRATERPWPSACAAALFAIHPLRAESVAWVAERKDVLGACFALASIWMYIGYASRAGRRIVDKRGRLHYAASVLLFALAIGSKPMFVTLPILLLLLDYWPLRRLSNTGLLVQRAAEKAPFFILSALSAWITVQVQAVGGTMQAAATIPLPDRAINALVSYAWYLWKMLVPTRLSPLYLHPNVPGGTPWAVWQIVTATLVLISISVAVWRTRTRGYPLFGWLWYLVSLAPVIGIIQVGGQAGADRYTYFPMIGVCVIAVWATTDSAKVLAARAGSRWLRYVVISMAAIAFVGYGALAWAQVGRWRDSETLYRHGLDVDPGNMLFHNNLGLILREKGELDEAAHHFEEALRIHPLYRQAMESLASIAVARGRTQEAERYLERALALKPGEMSGEEIDSGRIRLLLELADLLAARQQVEEASVHYREAAQLQPRLAALENEYALSMQRAGKPAEARKHFERAARIDPSFADAAYNLGGVLAEMEEFEEAAHWYRTVLELDPTMAEAHNNLGFALLRMGRSADAIAPLESALALRPDWTLPAQSLAWLLATDPDPNLRNPARAIELMERALRTDGSNVRLLGTMAAAQAAAGEFDTALKTVRTAIQIAVTASDSETAERLRQQEALYSAGRADGRTAR